MTAWDIALMLLAVAPPKPVEDRRRVKPHTMAAKETLLRLMQPGRQYTSPELSDFAKMTNSQMYSVLRHMVFVGLLKQIPAAEGSGLKWLYMLREETE